MEILNRYTKLSFTLTITLLIFSSQNFSQGNNSPNLLGIGFSKSLFPDLDRKDVQVAIELWGRELNQMMGFNYYPKIIIFDDFESGLEAIRRGDINIVTLLSTDYLNVRDQIYLEPALVAKTEGVFPEEFLILVRKDSKVTDLAQLDGKKLLLSSGGFGIISKLWLEVQLLKRGLKPPDDFFSTLKEVNKESQAVVPVFFNQADACIVRRSAYETMVELNPQVGEELKILSVSPGYIHSIFLFTKSFDERDKQRLVDACLKIETYPAGKQVLTLFKYYKLIPFKQSYLKNLEELISEYKLLKSKGLKKKK